MFFALVERLFEFVDTFYFLLLLWGDLYCCLPMLLRRPLQLNLQLCRQFSSPAKLWSCCCNANPEK